MTTQVTFTTDLTPEGLAELHERLGHLVAGATSAAPPVPTVQPSQETASTPSGSAPVSVADFDRAAKELRTRTGSNSRALLKQMYGYGDAEFTMPDVASDMGVGEPTIQARFRNLSKPLKRIRANYPSLPELWEAEPRNGRFHFRADPAWREAIERTWN